MPLYHRPGSPHWWVRITIAGVKTRCSTKTTDRGQAEEFERELHNRLWRLHKLGDRTAITWGEVAARWLRETQKRSIGMDRMILAWLSPRLDSEPLSAIDTDALQVLRDIMADEGLAPASINRYMALVRTILRKHLDHPPKVPMYTLEETDIRWLTQAQFNRLIKELPPHLKLCARFAVYTGLRMRSMLSLTWDRVDMKRKRLMIPGRQMKGKRTLGLPLSEEALKVLRECRIGNKTAHVFVYEGVAIRDCNTAAFKKAVARAKVGPLRWHDLRHTFASWAVQSGVTLQELMQLGDWRSYDMVLRYAHLAPDHLAAAANKIGKRA